MNLINKDYKNLSFYSVLGGLVHYITHTGINSFSPMNANFGIIYKASKDPKDLVIKRALDSVDAFYRQIDG